MPQGAVHTKGLCRLSHQACAEWQAGSAYDRCAENQTFSGSEADGAGSEADDVKTADNPKATGTCSFENDNGRN